MGVGISILRRSSSPRPAAEARLDGQFDLVRLELGLEGLHVFERVQLASRASGLDLLDLLLAAARPRHGEALGNQVVACVSALDLDHVAGGAEAGDLVRENNL